MGVSLIERRHPSITNCSLYFPPIENLIIILLSLLIDQLPTQFVVCGDFNGHSITWGCDKDDNSRRDRIDYFITDTNIRFICFNT